MADTGKMYIEDAFGKKYQYTGKIDGLDDWYIEYAYAQKDSQGCSNSDDEKQYLVKMFLVSSKENNEVFRALQAGRNGVINTLNQIKQEVFQLEKVVTRGCLGKEEKQFYEICLICNGIRQGEDGVNYIYNELSLDRKREFFYALATAIFNIHQKKIIHANISAKSVAYAMNMPQKAYIAGFEYAFRNEYENRNQSGKLPVWWVRPDDKSLLRLEGQEFFSPELKKIVKNKKGLNELDFATDVYSLGVLFHLYLTGEMPKKKEDSLCFDARISEKMSNLLEKMLEKDSEKRCTMEDVLDRLKKMNDSDFALTAEGEEDKSEPKYGISVEVAPVEEEDGDIPMAEESTPAKEEESAPPKKVPVEEEKPVKVEEEKPTKEWHGFDEPCPEKDGAWNMRKIERWGWEAWKKEKKNETEGYILLRKGEPDSLRTAAHLIGMGVIVVITKEELEKQAWEESSVKAYCTEKVPNEPTSIALKEKFQTLEEEIAREKAEAKRIAGGYYLWIKESIAPEKISRDEMKLLRRCDDLLEECKEEGRSPADKVNVGAFMDACEKISGALAKIEQLSFATMPALSTDKSAAQKINALLADEDFDEDALDALLEDVDDGEEKLVEIDGDIDVALDVFGATCAQAEEMARQNSQSKPKSGLEAIFAINVEAMEKDSAWDFVEEIATDAKKSAKAKDAIFSKADKKAFEESMKLLQKCYAALEEAEEEKEKEIQASAKRYFDEHTDEILEEIKNGNISVGEELRKEIQRILA